MLKIKIALVLLCYQSVAIAQVPLYGQCGGSAYSGPTNCASGLNCYKKDNTYSQCLPNCDPYWQAGWMCHSIVGLYGQCGGNGYTGATKCEDGLTCYVKDSGYSQCLPSCDPVWQAGWACLNGNTGSVTSTGSTSTNTGSFPGCQFRFGMQFKNKDTDYSAVDYIGIWIGDDPMLYFNQYWHGDMLRTCVNQRKLPVFYGYIIAFMARQNWGLKDCDVGSPNLCEKGASYIRSNRQAIVDMYRHYANEASKIIGRSGQIIWLIEPDFYQYWGDSHQEGGPNSGPYMRSLFDDIVTAIKSELPNSMISWDISPWLSESTMRTWWGYFASSNQINFIHTSGGNAVASTSAIKPGERTYSFMSTLTGKKIIADTGYGVAGASSGHNSEWDDLTNLRNRMNEGVISITQANPKWDWGNTINWLRQNLKLC